MKSKYQFCNIFRLNLTFMDKITLIQDSALSIFEAGVIFIHTLPMDAEDLTLTLLVRIFILFVLGLEGNSHALPGHSLHRICLDPFGEQEARGQAKEV